MRVYITGIEGMLGSALAFLHKRKGDEVFGCDVWKTPSEYSRIDIRNYNALLADMAAFKPDRVYHCAAMLGVANTERYRNMCEQVNEYGTTNVLQAAHTAGALEFVFLSSSEVYGNSVDGAPLHENSPLLGDNVYATGKAKGEQATLSYADRMHVIIPRMFNCYGINQVKQFFIPKAIDRCIKDEKVHIYGSPDNMRSYLFGHDAAQHITNVADSAPNGQIVNIAHPEAFSLGTVFSKIVKAVGNGESVIDHGGLMGYEDRQIDRDVPNRLGSIDVLRRYSRHTPLTLDIGLLTMVAMFGTLRDDWDYDREEGQ